jgi:hypothetical protein
LTEAEIARDAADLPHQAAHGRVPFHACFHLHLQASFGERLDEDPVCEGNPGHGRYNESAALVSEQLYGLVYYLHAKPTDLDADNLSKPIWDALEGLVYEDDKIIRHRRSGVIDLRTKDLRAFDLSALPDNVASALMSAVGSEEHILYVEYGSLRDDMFAFGLVGSAGR